MVLQQKGRRTCWCWWDGFCDPRGHLEHLEPQSPRSEEPDRERRRWCLRRGNSHQWNQEQRWGLWSSPHSAQPQTGCTGPPDQGALLGRWGKHGFWSLRAWAPVLVLIACQQAEPGEWLQHRVAGFDPLSTVDTEDDIPCEGVVVIGRRLSRVGNDRDG